MPTDSFSLLPDDWYCLRNIDCDTLAQVGGNFRSAITFALAIAVTVLITAWTARATKLIHLCIYADRPFGRLYALFDVFRMLAHAKLDAYNFKAAQWRVEIELLDPRPRQPRSHEYKNKTEYRAATHKWSDEYDKWEQKRSAVLRDLLTEGKEPPIKVPDVYRLIRAKDKISNYFDVLQSLNHRELQFRANVEIEDGYLAPLFLIGGLLNAYEDDWPKVTKNYGDQINDYNYYNNPGISPEFTQLRLFQFNCWLLWGPSVPFCNCWTGESRALQFGFGDENNSVDLLIASNTVSDLFAGVMGGGKAAPARPTLVCASRGTATGRIINVEDQEKKLPTSQQFLSEWSSRVGVLVGDKSPKIKSGYATESPAPGYYSAYLWIMLVTCDPRTNKPLFGKPNRWFNLLPFCLHTNIADADTLLAGKRNLVAQVVQAVGGILQHNEGIALHYVCAFDDSHSVGKSRIIFPTTRDQSLPELLRAETKGKPGFDRLVFCSGTADWREEYASCKLPEIVQELYDAIKDNDTRNAREDKTTPMLSVLDLQNSDASRKILVNFYDKIYKNAFPDPNERESFDNMCKYLRKKAIGWYGKSNYHIMVLCKNDGEPAGGVIADYLAGPNAGIIEFLTVHKKSQKKGLGRTLHQQIASALEADAEKANRPPPAYIVAEMDDPFITPFITDAGDDINPFERAMIWDRWGYRLIDFPYVQPALSEGQEPVGNLCLIARPASTSPAERIDAKLLCGILHEYMRLAMRIDRPERQEEFRRMRAFLTARSSVPLRRLPAFMMRRIEHSGSPEFDRAMEFFATSFGGTRFAISREAFARAVDAPPAHREMPRYHLWTLHPSDDKAGPAQGLAAFFSFPEGGFAGYIAFGPKLRKRNFLATLIAGMERQMLKDHPRARGWLIECDETTQTAPFTKAGFRRIALPYLHPTATEPRPATLLFRHFAHSPDGSGLKVEELQALLLAIYTKVYDCQAAEANRLTAAVIGHHAGEVPFDESIFQPR